MTVNAADTQEVKGSDDLNASGNKKNEKGQRPLRPLLHLVPYMLKYKHALVFAAIALIVAAGATLTLPIAVRRMIDFGFSGDDPSLIDNYFAMMILVAGVLALASALRYYCVIWLGERVIADVRSDVFAHVTKLSASFFDSGRSGEVVSRLTADTTQIKSAVGASASIALRNLVLFFGALIMMVVTSPQLSALVLVAIPFIVLPLVAFGRLVRKRSRGAQDTLADATAYASEAISGMRSLQAFTHEKVAISYFSEAVETAFSAARASTRARALLTACIIMLVFSSIVAVLWIGAKLVLSGEMTAGTLSQFVLYSVFAAGAMSELSQVWGEVSLAAGAAERLVEILRLDPEVRAPETPTLVKKPSQGRIGFEGISFSYPGAPDVPVLKDINLTISPGERVAIVGPSGAGKSTLFQLLMRFYDPQVGQVTLDGVDLCQTDPVDLRSQIALVSQDPTIFALPVKDNICLGAPEAAIEEVEAAARKGQAHGFISAMPKGYETIVGERGVTLSGGQRQRIAITRAILKNAPVLLLDEATSALDAESEVFVQSALDELMVGRTTLVIAHRLSTIQQADRILVIDDGQLVEEGTHTTLVAKGGLYARLAELQFDAHQRHSA